MTVNLRKCATAKFTYNMRLSGITLESTVDGPGLRIVLFTQGCPRRCFKCHNPGSWDYDAGEEFSVKQIMRLLKQNRKGKQGITFSGGEPFLHAAELSEIAQKVRSMDLDIVTFTGFTYEELLANTETGVQALLTGSDLLIDGEYIHKLRDIGLKFRGSSNQRIIDIAASQKTGCVVLWGEKNPAGN